MPIAPQSYANGTATTAAFSTGRWQGDPRAPDYSGTRSKVHAPDTWTSEIALAIRSPSTVKM